LNGENYKMAKTTEWQVKKTAKTTKWRKSEGWVCPIG
jgi:hypothetical protein